MGRTAELARAFGIDFFSVLSRGSQYRVESMMVRLAHTQNYLMLSPSKDQVRILGSCVQACNSRKWLSLVDDTSAARLTVRVRRRSIPPCSKAVGDVAHLTYSACGSMAPRHTGTRMVQLLHSDRSILQKHADNQIVLVCMLFVCCRCPAMIISVCHGVCRHVTIPEHAEHAVNVASVHCSQACQGAGLYPVASA